MDLNSNNFCQNSSVLNEKSTDDEDISSQSSSTSSSSSVPTEEDVFEVEKIIGHKIYEGKGYWKVRWVGYGPNDDTWEPRENFLDKKVLKMLNEFELERLSKKEKRKEIPRKSIGYAFVRDKQEDNEQEGEITDEKNDSWFGIKPDEGTLEQRRLFVPDRRLSKTEKLLTEIGTSPGVRILRRHLKEHSVEKFMSPKIKEEKTPQKKIIGGKKRKRTITLDSPTQEIETDEKDTIAMPAKPREKLQHFDKQMKGNGTERHESKLEVCKRPRHTDEEAPTSEFGISKNLKPKKLAKLGQKQKLKVFHKGEEVSKKRTKEERMELKRAGISKESTSLKPKEKFLDKLAAVRPGETGLLVPFASEGLNFVAAIECLKMEMRRSLLLFADNTYPISQEEFEELVMDGKVDKVRQLLSGQTAKSFDLNRVDEFGKTLLHKLCEIKCGVSHTQCELIDLLVTHGAHLNIVENGNNQIPLHIAIANRRLCHVRQLLSLHSPVNLVDKSGKSPLILSLDCSDFEFMKCLLKAGASVQPALERLYDDKDRNKRQFRFVTDHEAQLRKALNAERDAVLRNLSVKCISPIFVNPIHESGSVHCFHLKTQPQLPIGDFAYLLLASVAEFIQNDREVRSINNIDSQPDHLVETRMWGHSPIQNVTMNGRICQQLKPGNKFAFYCSPCQGENQIKLNLETFMCKSNNILITQVVLAQFFRPTRPPSGHSVASSFNRK